MKINILQKLILVLCISAAIISCSKEEESVDFQNASPNKFSLKIGTKEEMAKDPIYVDYVRAGVDFFSNIADGDKIADIIKDDKVTDEEEKAAYVAFGFVDKLAFNNYVVTQRDRYNYLDNTYGISGLPVEELTPIFTETIIDITMPGQDETTMDYCNWEFGICTAVIISGALIAQGGCLTIDVVTFGAAAVLCHGGAYIGQVAGHAQCQLQYQRCRDEEAA